MALLWPSGPAPALPGRLLFATAAFGDRSRGMAVYTTPLTGGNLVHHL